MTYYSWYDCSVRGFGMSQITLPYNAPHPQESHPCPQASELPHINACSATGNGLALSLDKEMFVAVTYICTAKEGQKNVQTYVLNVGETGFHLNCEKRRAIWIPSFRIFTKISVLLRHTSPSVCLFFSRETTNF